MYKSIIFDMDGTLIDSSFAMTSSVNHVRASIGLEPISQKFLEYHINAPDQNLPKLFYGTDEYDPNHKKRFHDHYTNTVADNIKIYDGIIELLVYLGSKGVVMSVATNASDHFAKNMLTSTSIADYFECIVGANMVSNPKPSPDILDYICNKLDINSHESLLIGDSQKDALAAQNAGMDFIFVHWGYGDSKKEDQSFSKVSDLKNHLSKL